MGIANGDLRWDVGCRSWRREEEEIFVGEV